MSGTGDTTYCTLPGLSLTSESSEINSWQILTGKQVALMNTNENTTAEHHAAKRRWLNSQESGYHKAMGNRQMQMIAIGGAIGTGLFLGAGTRLQIAEYHWLWFIWSAAFSPFLFYVLLANWYYIVPPAVASSPMHVSF